VLPAFVGLISQIDRSLGHGAALVKAILRKSPQGTLVKIAHPDEFTSAAVNSKQVPIPNIHRTTLQSNLDKSGVSWAARYAVIKKTAGAVLLGLALKPDNELRPDRDRQRRDLAAIPLPHRSEDQPQ
jgi:hypothetical protein